MSSIRRAGGPACAGTLLLALACAPAPEDVIASAARAVEDGHPERLRPLLHPSYADPLGDGRDLVRGLQSWLAEHPPERFDLERIETRPDPDSDRRVTLDLQVQGAWGGRPAYRLDGNMTVGLERWGGYRIRSGFLADLRDVAALVDAWAEVRAAPTPAGIRRLLHPRYAEGFATRDEATASWMAAGPVGARVTMVRAEPRDDLIHVDLHALTGTRPHIHRFSLRPVAGRWRIAAGRAW